MRLRKKIFMASFVVIVMIITILIKGSASSNLDKFINYDENKYMYTSFDLAINLESEVITNMTTYTDKSKDRIELLKHLKTLEQTEFEEGYKKSNANIGITIQDKKVFTKESFNYYYAKLAIYLNDNIICLEEHSEINNEDSEAKKIYYKINNETKKLVEKIIKDAVNEQSEYL
ncbi:hypothetical protein [Clostridium sardiniense]|uniref:hypothetical protein n=1 Tax=Clostridium sardiniense TaxID=29369 RepID=UPI003D347F88